MALLAGAAVLVYLAGYRFYGSWVARQYGLSDAKETPARRLEDGEDYVPTSAPVLLGQHFAAIAAVGPIAGPILAGSRYGWAPSLLWIALGAVFIGAVHDFSCLVASVRHDARSIGDVARLYLGRRAATLFSLFIWLSLVYVVVVFADLTATAFIDRPELGAENFGPGVATSSFLYLGLAGLMGWALYRLKWDLKLATAVFVPLIFVSIWAGQLLPIRFGGDAAFQQRAWYLLVLAYCFVASVIPMWILLQPRGYLGGFILYSTFVVGLAGLFAGRAEMNYPAWTGQGLGGAFPIFPLLFTTIACGACSGFHGLVASGTTSKQLSKETDAKPVGYGGMLLESLVAVIALATLVQLAPGSKELSLGPDEVYARGLAHFMGLFGIGFAAGVAFGKLAFATFIYDTLDCATRLGRYILQELFGLRGRGGAAAATLLTLAVPAVAAFVTITDASGKALPLWKVFWPVFGASNQLLAALSLAAIAVWRRSEGRSWAFVGVPAVLMSVVTLASLGLLVRSSWAAGRWLDPVGTSAAALLLLGVVYLAEAARAMLKAPALARPSTVMQTTAR